MKPEEIKKYIKLKREKADKNLDAFVQIAKCTREDLQVHFPASLLDIAMLISKLIKHMMNMKVYCSRLIVRQ
jgi:hypothetical protein